MSQASGNFGKKKNTIFLREYNANSDILPSFWHKNISKTSNKRFNCFCEARIKTKRRIFSAETPKRWVASTHPKPENRQKIRNRILYDYLLGKIRTIFTSVTRNQNRQAGHMSPTKIRQKKTHPGLWQHRKRGVSGSRLLSETRLGMTPLLRTFENSVAVIGITENEPSGNQYHLVYIHPLGRFRLTCVCFEKLGKQHFTKAQKHIFRQLNSGEHKDYSNK